MFKNYLKVMFRNIGKFKGYSFINIFGLAVGMSCCILILLYVTDELSYDRHFANKDRIHRIHTFSGIGETTRLYGTIPPALAPGLAASIPEVEAVTRRFNSFNLQGRDQDKDVEVRDVYIADPTFFEVFSFGFLQGSAETALASPDSLVLTDETAQRLYGTENPVDTEGNTVAHNHIHHGGYTGVSIGWVWGYNRSVSQNNRVEFNHIHQIGGVLSDMGSIYTLAVSPGTVIRNNHIHDVDANHYGGWGIYHDEGATHLLVENNVVDHTKFAPFNIHFAKEVPVRNNIFALGKLEQVSRSRVEPHKSVFFENNIVYWREGELLSKNWKDVSYTFHAHPKDKSGTQTLTNTFEFNCNLYFNPTKTRDEVKWAGGTWAEWQKRGKDRHSQYADALFVNPEQGDFTLRPESPSLALGFQPIDSSNAGPRIKTGPQPE